MRPSTIEMPFNFPLSDMRKAEIATEIADNLEECRVLEERFDAAKEEKKKVPGIMQHVRELGHFVRTGAESRNVLCRVEYDTPTPGVKRLTRTDTEEVVEECEMTEAESQGELFIGPAGPLTLPDPPADELPPGETDEPKEPEDE